MSHVGAEHRHSVAVGIPEHPRNESRNGTIHCTKPWKHALDAGHLWLSAAGGKSRWRMDCTNRF
jgi:hypothetical protein